MFRGKSKFLVIRRYYYKNAVYPQWYISLKDIAMLFTKLIGRVRARKRRNQIRYLCLIWALSCPR